MTRSAKIRKCEADVIKAARAIVGPKTKASFWILAIELENALAWLDAAEGKAPLTKTTPSGPRP